MSWNGYKILAVVPARGGSKGIPRKNLCTIGDMTLIGHTARVIKSLPWIDKAVLSTEDEEIAAEGKKHGLEVPFMRPVELAGDKAKSVDMWQHAWIASEEYYGCRFDISILLQPTSPFRIPEDVTRTVKALFEGNHLAAATVSRAPGDYTPHKCLTVDQNGIINFFLKDGAQYSLRQDIPPFYFRNGICYAVTRQALLEKGIIIEEDCAAVIIERPIVNIDEPIDLQFARFLWTQYQCYNKLTGDTVHN
jgi:CMP-N-acetylneuraminic acid synthetase